MALFVTGDTHGYIDPGKLNHRRFPMGRELSKEDYLIICGDFGLVWDNGKSDLYWRKWLDNKPFTTLFIDGNHENFDLLESFPREIWNGGVVHRIGESIYHLTRGQLFRLCGRTLFTFGGAPSSDRAFRTEGISWWPREMPGEAEYAEGLKNLEAVRWSVDYIFTHTCSVSMQREIGRLYSKNLKSSIINEYFETIESRTSFKQWFFGHFHKDAALKPKHQLVYQKIIPLGE